ncbi:MAG: EamA family transporter [Erysipelotrichaceae bacterium]|nr:EamA family transporter [Erysipelotrichaceae bacterium]
MNKYALVKICSVVFSALSQLLLKKSADKEYDSLIGEYLNPSVIISYGVFFACLLLGTYALKGISLSYNAALESLSHLLVPFFSFLFLKEKIRNRQVLGIILIFIGVIIYSV